MNRKEAREFGFESEKRFELECAKRKIPCYCSTWLSQSDYVIEVNGTLYRVQIKSSGCEKDNIPVKCSWGQGKTGWKPYTKKETDLVAAYIKKTNDWYILPVEEITNVLGFNISPCCRLSKYKNNWSFLSLKVEKEKTEPSLFDTASILQKEGLTVDQIAVKLGRNPTYIGRLFRRGGAGLKNRLALATKETLEKMYLTDKLPMDEIAGKLNISSWYIRKKFREFNINVRTNPNPNGRTRNVPLI